MANFLGEFPIDVKDTHLASMSREHLALEYIFQYGQIDGAHHKTWVLDQVTRILNGAEIINCRIAKWDNGYDEIRYEIGSSAAYEKWVEDYNDGGEYSYDEGIAP